MKMTKEQCEGKLYSPGDLRNHKPTKLFEAEVMGTVEPRYTDEHCILGDGKIHDDALGFIYGAIKKYGSVPIYYNDLKKYIGIMAERIGERNV